MSTGRPSYDPNIIKVETNLKTCLGQFDELRLCEMQPPVSHGNK